MENRKSMVFWKITLMLLMPLSHFTKQHLNRSGLTLPKHYWILRSIIFMMSSLKMFFFTDKDTELLTRKLEVNDNVIPASNSVMAHNLFKLGKLYHSDKYVQMS